MLVAQLATVTCVYTCLQVTVLWPPKSQLPLPAGLSNQPPQSQEQAPAAETFSTETSKILAGLGSGTDDKAREGAKLESIETAMAAAKPVRLEVLKHPLGVVGVQWSPASTSAGEFPWQFSFVLVIR